MDTNIFSQKKGYKFVLISWRKSCLRIFVAAKCGDRTLMGCFQPDFSPKLEHIHRTKLRDK